MMTHIGIQPLPARDSGKCEYASRVVSVDGKPVANIWVGYRPVGSRTPWFQFVRTQGNGIFRIRGLTAGEYHVWLEPGGHLEGFRRTPAVRVVVSPESTYQDLILRE